jgi:hypothetical protein
VPGGVVFATCKDKSVSTLTHIGTRAGSAKPTAFLSRASKFERLDNSDDATELFPPLTTPYTVAMASKRGYVGFPAVAVGRMLIRAVAVPPPETSSR